ncbi:hypothetical protein COO60DRAFT_1554956 [Scenedesmus sp. NREL 46B-D3]|nr:hypothetical protein COO60DRAFT_1554956 [Scenedesmus sp. NREL 46B-D3]
MRSLATANQQVAASSRRPSFTASRRPTLADRSLRVLVLAVARSEGTERAAHTPLHMLLGGAIGVGLLAPGASIAVEEMPSLLPQQVGVEAAAGVQPAVELAMQYAPDLVDGPVTDLELENDDSHAGGNMFVNGLEWMMEEGLEVTNFKENNFAAVGAPSTSMWLSNSPWCLMWDAYCNVLTARPVATKLATGMVGTFLGDLLAQLTQGLMRTHNAAAATIRGRSSSAAAAGSSSAGGAFELDLARTARLVAFSALVGTPVAFVWFNLLDQYVMPADPTNPLAVFSKVALDQVLMAPCMTSMFFASMALLEGSRGRDVADTVKSKLKPTLLANWTVWPIAHVINFALVPPAQRILYINVINIAWTAFMSHMASNSSQDKPAGQPAPARNSNSSGKQLQQAGRGM